MPWRRERGNEGARSALNRIVVWGIAVLIMLGIMQGLAVMNGDWVDLNVDQKESSLSYRVYKPRFETPERRQKKSVPKPKKAAAKKRVVPKTEQLSESVRSREEEVSVEEQAVDSAELDAPPVVVDRIIPQYPELARKAGVEAKVLVELIIDEKGKVQSAKIVFSSQSDYGFEKNTLAAIKRIRFKPLRKDGKAVVAKVIYPIDFVLTE